MLTPRMVRIWMQKPRVSRMFWTMTLLLSAMTMTFSNVSVGGNANRRHPLDARRRRLHGRQVRFLTMGGPSTWGLGLPNPENDGYARLLSASAHNAGQRVGGPTLASLCTQSIVGGNIYDVIVLEFSGSYTEEFKSLSLLASRLRQRFPQAKIIFLELWSPSQASFQHQEEDDDKRITFDEWRRNTRKDITWGSPEFLRALEGHDWHEDPRVNDRTRSYSLKDLAQQVRGSFYRLPKSSNTMQSLKEAKDLFLEVPIEEYDQEEGDGGPSSVLQYTLSPYGHALVANAILSMIDGASIMESSRTIRDEVGTWGSGDSCQLWYDSGMVEPSKLSHHGFGLRQFSKTPPNDKYALELSEHGGSIAIHNPFKEDRM
eukprot:scaffold14589_cov106-Cylindrotheca_fusiformis.AAC.1